MTDELTSAIMSYNRWEWFVQTAPSSDHRYHIWWLVGYAEKPAMEVHLGLRVGTERWRVLGDGFTVVDQWPCVDDTAPDPTQLDVPRRAALGVTVTDSAANSDLLRQEWDVTWQVGPMGMNWSELRCWRLADATEASEWAQWCIDRWEEHWTRVVNAAQMYLEQRHKLTMFRERAATRIRQAISRAVPPPVERLLSP